MLLVNGRYPGPTVTATEGDEIVVHVTNNANEPISVHWHGLLQRDTNYMDGVDGTTQCGISPNRTFTYRFSCEQRGTFWYHSHSGVQQTDGFKGALIIQPRLPLYSIDEEYIIELSDHYNTLANVLLNWYLSPAR